MIMSSSRRSDKPPGYPYLAKAQSSHVQKAQAAPTCYPSLILLLLFCTRMEERL